MNNRDNFPPKVVVKLAERAGYFCSNPACPRITVGPCASDDNKSTKVGVAAHICAASSGGPRFDLHQEPSERKSITNAIWLCGTCSILIDKNNGDDYSAPQLRRWKQDHEAFVKMLVESGFNPLLPFPPQSYVADSKLIATSIVRILEDKGVLFMPFSQEDPSYVALSLDDLTSAYSEKKVTYESDLRKIFGVQGVGHNHIGCSPPKLGLIGGTISVTCMRQ